MSLKHVNAAVVKTSADAGTWTAVASAPTLDRDGEVVDPFAFAPLPASVPVHDGHRFDRVVGRAVPRYDAQGTLYVDGRFSSIPEAQRTRTLVLEGVLDSMSVAFHNPVRTNVEGTPHITKGELLAVDFVSVPSNRDARVVAVRALGLPSSAAAWKARIAAMEAELALLDLHHAKRSRPPSLARLYAQLAEAQAFLSSLA